MLNKVRDNFKNSVSWRLWTVALSMAVVIGLGFFVRHQPDAIKPIAKFKPAEARKSVDGDAIDTESKVDPANKARWALNTSATPPPTPTTPPDPPGIVRSYDAKGALLASFTVGARTVLFVGPNRTFKDPSATDATITTNAWVRLLPANFTGAVDKAWLDKTAAQNTPTGPPDILGIAMQYITGAPKILDNSGHVIAGDAGFGPLGPDNLRVEGADFNDFVGIPWTYNGSVVDRPEAAQLGYLDCSGFQRMVWGYRGGLPLDLTSPGGSLSRRVYQIYNNGPGIILMPNNGHQMTDFSRMQPGDVAFLDVETDDGTQLDHMGIYLGIDSRGDRRFLSSRKIANGPTFGDIDGKAILNGTSSYFAQRFRAVRRF